MKIEVVRADYRDIEAMRDLYRQEANCQLIHDSMLGRGIADAFAIWVDGRLGGYGGVMNQFDPGQVSEFYTLPHLRPYARSIFRDFLTVSQATKIEAQTNVPFALLLLYDFAQDIRAENYLFADLMTTRLPTPGGIFRKKEAHDRGARPYDPDGDFVLEHEGTIIGSGGFLCHYNPPYGDIYMHVWEGARGKGYGAFLVQELKRVAYEAGRVPSARCNATNIASRKTLERAGMLPIGRLLVGNVAGAPSASL